MRRRLALAVVLPLLAGCVVNATTTATTPKGATPSKKPSTAPATGGKAGTTAPKLDGRFDLKIGDRSVKVLRARAVETEETGGIAAGLKYAISADLGDPTGAGSAGAMTILLGGPFGEKAQTVFQVQVRDFGLAAPGGSTNPISTEGEASIAVVGKRLVGKASGKLGERPGDAKGEAFTLDLDLPLGPPAGADAPRTLPEPVSGGGTFEPFDMPADINGSPVADGQGGVWWSQREDGRKKPLAQVGPGGPFVPPPVQITHWTPDEGMKPAFEAALFASDGRVGLAVGKDALLCATRDGVAVHDPATGERKSLLEMPIDAALKALVAARFPAYATIFDGPGSAPESIGPDVIAADPKAGTVWATTFGNAWRWGADGAAKGVTAAGKGTAFNVRSHAMAIAPDGAAWIVDRDASRVGVVAPDGKLRAEFFVPGKPGAVAFGPDGDAWIGSYEGLLHASPAGQVLATVPFNAGYTTAVVVEPGGAVWSSGANDAALVRLAADGKTLKTYEVEEGAYLLTIADGELRSFGPTGVHRLPLPK